jgi:hypothetical protein
MNWSYEYMLYGFTLEVVMLKDETVKRLKKQERQLSKTFTLYVPYEDEKYLKVLHDLAVKKKMPMSKLVWMCIIDSFDDVVGYVSHMKKGG